MDYTNLEDEMVEAIQRCCSTDSDKENALRYFKDCLINDLINEALEN